MDEEEITMSEEEMLAHLQLVWDNMGLQIHDKKVCGEMLLLLDEMHFRDCEKKSVNKNLL